MGRRAIVVGAGLGGLVAAARLAAAGWRVTVLEQEARVGGKCHREAWGGWVFDTGPSVLTLPGLVDEHFAACGRRREEFLAFEPVEPGCRYFWPDGSVFDAPGTWEGLRAAVARDFPAEVAGLERFMAWTRRLWRVSERHFLREAPGWGTPGRLRGGDLRDGLALLRPGSLAAAVRAHFRDPRLVQLFCRFATYNGSDPERTPAAFAVIAHAEFGFGSWRCRGGMYELPRALVRLAEGLGVEVRVGTAAVAVRCGPGGGRVEAVETAGGEVLPAEAVVVNADAAAALEGPLLAGMAKGGGWRRRLARTEASGGGCVLLLALEGTTPRAAVHNVMFPADYAREFREIFGGRAPLTDPTVYVSVPARAEPALAPPGSEGWFVLVNAPAVPEAEAWPDGYGDFLLGRLAAGPLRLERGRVRWRRMMAPPEFARRFGAWRGSLYGPSSNHLLAAFRRVPNRGPARGLYFCGGSAHPGGGIPLVLLGGAAAARAAQEDAGRQ